jgi:hypothetical protein
MMKIEGSESISHRHGSADSDPDLHQNVMDPQHCFKGFQRVWGECRLPVPCYSNRY